MIEHLIIAFVVAALVWWLCAKLVGPMLAASGTPFLTTLGNAFVSGAILLGLIAGVLWYFGGPSIFGR
jgi:p-aminobenzoyl-glutamate transporter AbgT